MKTQTLVMLALVAAGCGSSTPPELVKARSAYDQVSKGPASRLAPADVETAKQTLAVAERSYDNNGDSQETRDIAYAAERQAQIADARARTLAALDRRRQSLLQAQQIRDQQARSAEEQLTETQKALEQERQARADAERRAADAAQQLAQIASVKQEPRGMVITLPGGVLFASGKSDLLGTAKSKLDQVANALSKQQPDAKIRIEGYTDSHGPASLNQDLSQKRADSVRDYLAGHGIAKDRITAEGFGSSKPVADNATAEGRANNRRVEIIVESGQQQQQQQQQPPMQPRQP